MAEQHMPWLKNWLEQKIFEEVLGRLTLVFGLLDDLRQHGLDHADVPIQQATHNASQECHPKAGRKANNQERQHGAAATKEQDGFSTDTI